MKYLTLISLFTFILSENITFTSLIIKPNKLFKFHKFTYSNYSKKGPIIQGFNSSFTLTKLDDELSTVNDKFFFIINETNYKAKPHKICSDQNATHAKLFYNYTNLTEKTTLLSFDAFLDAAGVYRTFFVFCGNTSVSLTGAVWYFNTDSYASAENFYCVQLYLILTFYYVIIAVYWLAKMILNYKKIKLIMTLFSVMIPFVILENIMRLEFFTDMKNSGNYNMTFKSIESSFRVIKNIILRIIFFLISVGFLTTQNTSLIKPPIKVLTLFSVSMVFYSILAVAYEVSLIYYEIDLSHPLGYLFFSASALIVVNFYIWYFMFVRLENLSKNYEMKKFDQAMKDIKNFSNAIYAIFVIACVHSVLFFISKIFSNYYVICYMKWVVDMIEQSLSLVMFTTLAFFIWGTRQVNAGYTLDNELNKSGDQKQREGNVIIEKDVSNSTNSTNINN